MLHTFVDDVSYNLENIKFKIIFFKFEKNTIE